MDLFTYLTNMTMKMRLLSEDLERMKNNPEASRKSIERLSKLYSTEEEAKQAQEMNSSEQFVLDKLKDIFGEK